MMPVGCARFGDVPSFEMMVWWLQNLSLNSRVSRFQCLLPYPRPLHPRLLVLDPLLDARILRLRRIFYEERGQRRQRRVNEEDGWELVVATELVEFVEFTWAL